MSPKAPFPHTPHRALQLAAFVAVALGTLATSPAFAGTIGTLGTISAQRALVVSTTQSPEFGTILVSGTALYTLKPGRTPCRAKCLRVWPEVLLPKGVKNAAAGAGVDAARLGTVKRKGGALQVTYAGMALYRFSHDTAPGLVTGNVKDTWGTWSVVVISAPAMAPAQPGPGTAPVPTTTPNATSETGGSTRATPTTPMTSPPTTVATSPPTTTTSAPGGGGVSF
jgi:predicted lipoprotein with Yx(FWY)xxD motif